MDKGSNVRVWPGILVLFGLCLVVAIVTGCGNGQNTGTSATNTLNETEKPLVLYANDFVDVIGEMFTEATGYEIEVVHGGGGEILARLEAEQANPQWDIMWLDGIASLYGLAERGFFLEGWEPDNLAYLSEQGRAYLPDNKAYFPTGIHACAVIAYNTNAISAEEAPKTWAEFFQMEATIGMADPGVAAPAYPVVSWFFYDQGIEQAQETFQELFASERLRVFPKNGPLGQALASGEIEIATLQESNGYGLKMAGEPIEIIWPEEGAPGTVRVVSISKDSKNVKAAKAFVEFVLDPETQQKLTELEDTDSFFTPLAEGVSPRADREKNPKLVVPDVEWASKHEQEIKQWFADRAVQ